MIALNLIFLKKDNAICVLLVNATKCLNLIGKLNELHLRYYIEILPYNNCVRIWSLF